MGRIVITAKQAAFLKALMEKVENTSDTLLTIGTNLDIDGVVTAENIPDTSELEDGTYTLTVTIAEGVATYSWS